MKKNNVFQENQKFFYKTCYNSIRFNINNAYKINITKDEKKLRNYIGLYLKKMFEEVPIDTILKIIDIKYLKDLINLQDILITNSLITNSRWYKLSLLNRKEKIFFLLKHMLKI